MGPSGSGKTSLVTAVAGRIKVGPNNAATEGSILFRKKTSGGGGGQRGAVPNLGSISGGGDDDDGGGGGDMFSGMARRVGFVTQDDCLFPSLTVRETLRYAALLRLPSRRRTRVKSHTRNGGAKELRGGEEGEDEDEKEEEEGWSGMSRVEKLSAAEEVSKQLGLETCADTVIGGMFMRGVSGGERKRVCIAVEVITNPSVLILDEPTSGLDSTIALRLADTLSSLARDRGRAVLLTIHQPSSRVMATMDAVLLLSRVGRDVHSHT